MSRTLLFVGAGRHQRRALARVKELGARVVAVDRNAEAPGLELADVAEVVDFLDADAVAEVGRRHAVDGVHDGRLGPGRARRGRGRRGARPARHRARVGAPA